jgi:phenylalanyl-tRNA synthetase beta chain
MKFSISWLKEYLITTATTDEIVECMNKIGLEVEEIIDKSKELCDFNCVMVESCENHPNSERLHVCKVKRKDSQELLNIVCGAPNARSGMKAILAPVGSILPNGMKLEKVKIRGIESNGMLCSEKELGIGENHEGIVEVNENVELGTNVADIFKLNDPVIDISITINRADCLGVYGIARDLSCAGLGTLKKYDEIAPKLNNSYKNNIELDITDENCPLFTFREIKNLKNCESPEWLKNRLKSIDINPKNALVDISNYVLISFNKPLHCYDVDKIKNCIYVKPAEGGEIFTDLFDKKYTLPKGATIICDDEKILCLGGVIGAKESCSSLDTTSVLVESAIFDPINTAKTGRLLNVQTDSRYRFERGSDYGTVDFALDYACKLILEICGGEVSYVIKYKDLDYERSLNRNIELNVDYIEKVLGLKIEKTDILEILKKFNYEIVDKGDVLNLKVPFYKNNIIVKEDIIDDIIRMYGYDKLKDDDFINTDVFEKNGNLFEKKFENKLYQVRQKLVTNGITELLTYSFLNEEDDSNFCEINRELNILNPIISELSHLRQSLLTNILITIKKNNNRGFNNLSFFEIGKIFNKCALDSENTIVAGVRCGKDRERNIHSKQRNFDIFDVKKDLFDVLNIFKINGEKIAIQKNTLKYYHPNRSGAIFIGKTLIGYFGELHPSVTEYFELKNRPVAFEFFVDNLPQKLVIEEQNRSGFSPSDFQVIERDFAFIVDRNLEVGNILREIYDLDKKYIQKVTLFDIYYDESNSDKKSIAFNIKIQPKDKNLDKQEIDGITDKIIGMINNKYNGLLRDR